MRMSTALAAATLLALLLVLPTAGADFNNPSSNDADSFMAGTLAAPTGLASSCGATITLDWTATVDTYATGHRVFRSTTSGGPYSQIAEISPRTTVTYDDTPAAGIYYYVVRAYSLSWESADGTERGSCVDRLLRAAVGEWFGPSSGPKTGGTSVVISGSGFTGATAVDFGATPATGYVVDSDTQITATAPAGTVGTTVDVQVTTPLGSSANTVADDYTYTGITYYVRTDGSDANTGLSNSPAGAWLTIQKAASTMVAGDTVRVQPGTYPETVTPANAGTAANPITYLADGVVVVDGGNTRCKAFDVVGTGYLVIDGFEITDQPDCGGADSAVDINNANNVTVRNNIIHDTGRDAIYYKGTSANGLVENNLIYNIDDDGSTPIGGGNHIFRNNTFAGAITGWALENGLASNLFENNIFWVTAGNGAIQNTGLGNVQLQRLQRRRAPGHRQHLIEPAVRRRLPPVPHRRRPRIQQPRHRRRLRHRRQPRPRHQNHPNRLHHRHRNHRPRLPLRPGRCAAVGEWFGPFEWPEDGWHVGGDLWFRVHRGDCGRLWGDAGFRVCGR